MRRRCVLMAAVLMPAPWSCWAEVTVAASGSARYEHDSNVFDLQSGFPVPGTTDFTRADSLYTYGAAVDVNYFWDRQQLFATLADNEIQYGHFTQLNHNEYNVDLGLNWKLLHSLDGSLETVRIRTMVPFTNTQGSEFALQTEQRETGKLGYEFIPDWRVEGTGGYRTLDQSFTLAPSLDLHESSGTVAVKYLGRAGLTSGLSGGYTVGDYTGPGAAFNPSYHQTTLAVTALYMPTGRSSLNGSLGYSDRKSDSQLNSVSGFTGELDFESQLTGKTSMHVLVNRGINSYVSNLGSEIDSVGAFTVRWQTTYLLGVIAGYTWTERQLPGQGNNPPGSDRTDHLQSVSLNLDYEPFRWLSLMPYVNYQTRKSNFIGGDFNASVVGIYFTAQWQNSRKPDLKLKQLNSPAYVH
jgi:hypothetical protein